MAQALFSHLIFIVVALKRSMSIVEFGGHFVPLPLLYLSVLTVFVLAYIFSHENSTEDYAKFSTGKREAHDEMPRYVENKPRDRGGAEGTLG